MPMLYIPERAFRVIVGAEGGEQKAKDRIKQMAVDHAEELVNDE